MNGYRFAAVLIPVAALLLGGPAGAQSPPSQKARIYFDDRACMASKLFSDNVCRTAYLNAKAEFDEKAPRFEHRGECEHYFRRCMIAEISAARRQVLFLPAMRGFAIDNGPKRTVSPFAEGAMADTLFQPRAVDRADATVSPARIAEAKAAWLRIIAPPPTPLPIGSDNEEAPRSGSIQTYPMSKEMLEDLRRRQRALGLPTTP